ncbi:MAG: four helix bundle protein [Candidatus Levyibacteriota bacterium]
MIKSFLDLEVYKESFKLSLEIEELLEDFPPKEKFLLSDQMKRASRAIPALIAEGYSKRVSVKEFKKFLRDSLSEANEMINHLSFAKARNYVKKLGYADELIDRYNIFGKRLTKLHDNWQKF